MQNFVFFAFINPNNIYECFLYVYECGVYDRITVYVHNHFFVGVCLILTAINIKC